MVSHSDRFIGLLIVCLLLKLFTKNVEKVPEKVPEKRTFLICQFCVFFTFPFKKN